jgi:dihydrofolate reductase
MRPTDEFRPPGWSRERNPLKQGTHSMANLIYSAITSLDGYVNDEEGGFGWAEPDEEVHSFVNELERPVGTHLYGRRMYEVLRYWEDPPDLAEQPAYIQDYAQIWQAAEKVVYSNSLESASTARTRIEREFDPAAVRRMKEGAGADLSVGGPTLAAEALRAGLVDELHQFLNPVVVGGGTAWLPAGLRLELELLDERRFAGGVIHLHYRTRT